MSDKKVFNKVDMVVDKINSTKTFDTILTDKEKKEMTLCDEANIYDFKMHRVVHLPTLIEKEINQQGVIDGFTLNTICDLMTDMPIEQAGFIDHYGLDPDNFAMTQEVVDGLLEDTDNTISEFKSK